MASVNFLYRSTKERSPLSLRLLFRHNQTDFVIGGITKLEVSKLYWSKHHKQKFPKDIDIKNKQAEINAELSKIENHIIQAFAVEDPVRIDKEWLREQIKDYYSPSLTSGVNSNTSEKLIEYINIYIEDKKSEITLGTIKTCNVIKALLKRFENSRKKIILISDVDLAFRLEFERYCLEHNYAANTISRSIKFIKTVCLHARSKRIATSYQLDNIKASFKKVDNIYLSFDELDLIENLKDIPEYLQNARDWLLISCYTGQRISDFMRFKKSMITTKKNKAGITKTYIEFTQIKTGKEMTIPLHYRVLTILDKRCGEFPRRITDQKYNDYIKIVCRLAGITNNVQGSKKLEIKPNSKVYRKETGIFEKWELVSSHIGRRSFATNFYDKIPTALLISATGHSTEAMFLNYIGKSKKDLAEALAEHF